MLFGAVLILHSHYSVSDNLAIARKRLGERDLVGKRHYRDFILGFEVADGFDCGSANLRAEGIYAPCAIYKQNDETEAYPAECEMVC
jgi:hypothetical protein